MPFAEPEFTIPTSYNFRIIYGGNTAIGVNVSVPFDEVLSTKEETETFVQLIVDTIGRTQGLILGNNPRARYNAESVITPTPEPEQIVRSIN